VNEVLHAWGRTKWFERRGSASTHTDRKKARQAQTTTRGDSQMMP
jgi:hypothetical protein